MGAWPKWKLNNLGRRDSCGFQLIYYFYSVFNKNLNKIIFRARAIFGVQEILHLRWWNVAAPRGLHALPICKPQLTSFTIRLIYIPPCAIFIITAPSIAAVTGWSRKQCCSLGSLVVSLLARRSKDPGQTRAVQRIHQFGTRCRTHPSGGQSSGWSLADEHLVARPRSVGSTRSQRPLGSPPAGTGIGVSCSVRQVVGKGGDLRVPAPDFTDWSWRGWIITRWGDSCIWSGFILSIGGLSKCNQLEEDLRAEFSGGIFIVPAGEPTGSF